MKEFIIGILASIGYPVYLQGSLSGADWPPSFFTIWTASEDGPHYDNGPISTIWTIDINFYSIEPALVNTQLVEAKRLLRASGFIVGGKGRDVPSDEDNYSGRSITAYFIEQED